MSKAKLLEKLEDLGIWNFNSFPGIDPTLSIEDKASVFLKILNSIENSDFEIVNIADTDKQLSVFNEAYVYGREKALLEKSRVTTALASIDNMFQELATQLLILTHNKVTVWLNREKNLVTASATCNGGTTEIILAFWEQDVRGFPCTITTSGGVYTCSNIKAITDELCTMLRNEQVCKTLLLLEEGSSNIQQLHDQVAIEAHVAKPNKT